MAFILTDSVPRLPQVPQRGFAAFPSKAAAARDTPVSILTDLAVGLDVLLCGKCMSYLQPPTVPQSDGFVFRSLEYIRFSGDPAQVSDQVSGE